MKERGGGERGRGLGVGLDNRTLRGTPLLFKTPQLEMSPTSPLLVVYRCRVSDKIKNLNHGLKNSVFQEE